MNRLPKRSAVVIKPCLTLLFILITGLLPFGAASAANLSLSDVPLDVHEGVAPNILLTFDDSGSMEWSYVPDSLWNVDNFATRKANASNTYNSMYYDPKVRYVPGVKSDGSSLGDSSFNAAWDDGYNQSNTCTVDLETNYRASWDSGNNCDTNTGTYEYQSNAPSGSGGAAYYYVYNSTNTGCSGSTSADACYDAVIITSTTTSYVGGPDRTDCANPLSCTFAEESRNFANWYSYYRKRIMLAKNAAGRSFAKITSTVRVAHQSLNADTTISLFKTFTGTPRDNFFSWLYARNPNGSTPIPDAYVRAGKKFSESGINSPYAHDPGTQDLPEYACRQNFNINFTDGYWNQSSSTTVGNYDGANHSIPSTQKFGVTQYTQQHPYSDSNSNYLADYAFYYWINDLRTDLDDNVPAYVKDSTTDITGNGTVDNTDIFWNPVNDPANWQHMVTFNVGLGINGNLTFNDTTYQDLISGTQSWTSDHVDDLWHAAINGRGQYFNAQKNPGELVKAFTDVLNLIGQRTGSSSAPAPSAPNYQVGTKLYQPVYDTSDWHGDLRRYDVTNLTTVEWSAKDILNNQDYATGRNIITFDPAAGKGIPFRYSSLNNSQQTQLTSADVVNYIRGDRSKELSNGGTFRNRSYVLGDIVDSAPLYIGPPDRLFPDTLETAKYSDFAALYKDRKPMVWVGANDGILHAFDADTGEEKLGFVPTKVFDNLPDLTSTSYSHKFFVDGSPTERDVFYSGNWHTVLVGGLNKGGQEIYALNVTNPASFTEANAASLVLWEFTDADDPDLGYTFSAPQVAKSNDTTGTTHGRWMAYFGNGYNNTQGDGHTSSSGDAVLYIVDIKDGSLVKKFDTGIGRAQDPTGKQRPNGLSTVALVDADANYTVDYIYAGDLFGNLWKFDVTSNDPANWTIDKNALNVIAPLFIATDANGNVQPITTAPVVGPHASQSGFMINFGTGKYLELGDLTDTSIQTFYGVWDRNETAINTILRKHTQAQTILETVTNQFANFSARVTSDNPVNWYAGTGLPTSGTEFLGWHMDLVDETNTPVGERVIADPQRRSTRIIFVTNTPSADPCMAGGSSWIMELNATTGQRLVSSPFDYNNDGIIDYQDLVKTSVDINGDGVIDANDYLAAGSGIQDLTGGKLSRPTILLDSNNNEVKLSSTGSASISKVVERGDQYKINRRSWQQLIP